MFDYKKAFADRRADLEDLPHNLVIETVLGCNIKCRMCPVTYARETMSRRKLGVIDVGLFDEILRQISDAPRNLLLNCLGEPLLHPQFPRLVRMASARGHRTTIITNAVLLDRAMATAIIEAGVDGVQISMDRYHQEAYEATRVGARYETVVDNVLRFAGLAASAGRPITVDLNHIVPPDHPDEAAAFFETYSKHVDHIWFNNLTNFWGHFDLPAGCDASSAPLPPQRSTKLPCLFLWESLCISVEGRAMLCANDFNRQSGLPRVTDKPIAEIWTGEVRELRKRQLAGVFTGPCQSCTRWEVPDRSPIGRTRVGRPFRRSRLVNWFVRPQGFVDHPTPDQVVRGPLDVMGWALAGGGKRVAKVEVIVDGSVRKAADYECMRPDVTTLFPDREDRWFPGFLCRFDSAEFAPGVHTVEAIVSDDTGRTASIGTVRFTVDEPAPPSGPTW